MDELASPRILVGDTVTFSFRQPWWKRVLVRLGWMKTPQPHVFIVTAAN